MGVGDTGGIQARQSQQGSWQEPSSLPNWIELDHRCRGNSPTPGPGPNNLHLNLPWGLPGLVTWG